MGEDITSKPAHEIVRMGISQSPEGRKLFPRMTVVENLEMGLFSATTGRGSRKTWSTCSRSSRASQSARLRSRDDVRRRAADVRDRARDDGRPKLLMLDEPSMGLAPIFVERIFETVVEINKEDSILLVEQNALMALGVAQRAYVMQTGRIVLEARRAN